MVTLQEIKNRIYNDFVASFKNAITPLKKSFFEVLANAVSGAIQLLYIYLDNVQKDSFLNSCTQSRVLNYFAPLLRLTQKEATIATGSVIFTGVNGSVVPAGTKVVYNSNLEYQTTVEGTIALGSIEIVCESIETGTVNNTINDISLFLVVPVSGVDNNASSTDGFSGAIDKETIESLRTRCIVKQGDSPLIDNNNYYKSLAMELSNVKAAFIADIKNGTGTFGVTILTYSNDGVAIQADLDEVEAYFVSKNAVPIYVDTQYFLPVIVYQDFEILLAVDNSDNQASVEQLIRDYIYLYQKAGTTFEFLGLSKALQEYSARLISPLPSDNIAIAIDEVLDAGTITWS